MAFVLKQSATYKWPVTLIIPADGGRREKHTFDGEFRRIPQARINEIRRLQFLEEQGRLDVSELLTPQEVATEVLAGWSGVVDDEGEEIPFSETALNQLLDLPGIAAQIMTAWGQSIEAAKKPTSKGL
jgi:hypothetical protein